MPTKPDQARARADASFSKQERASDAAKAMTEYLANGRLVRERMAKLKALRLAKEAADKNAQLAAPAAGRRQGPKNRQGS